MGIRDSSKTRAQPVFDRLLAADASGHSWIPRLLALPKRFDGVVASIPSVLGPLQQAAWSPKEKGLAPPSALLEWLVENPAPASYLPANLGTKDQTRRRKRTALLLNRDPVVLTDALRDLTDPDADRAWCTFEGPTKPDVYLETPELIVVIEGKRKETGPTTNTTWMPVRDQMLRHIDGALESSGGRDVIGFYLVEGDGDSMEVPPAWRAAATQTVSPDMLIRSLPHRSDAQRAQIAASFFGVSTWQRVCNELSIPFTALPDLAGT